MPLHIWRESFRLTLLFDLSPRKKILIRCCNCSISIVVPYKHIWEQHCKMLIKTTRPLHIIRERLENDFIVRNKNKNSLERSRMNGNRQSDTSIKRINLPRFIDYTLPVHSKKQIIESKMRRESVVGNAILLSSPLPSPPRRTPTIALHGNKIWLRARNVDICTYDCELWGHSSQMGSRKAERAN